MKKAVKYVAITALSLLAFSSLVACSESCAQSIFRAKTLENPTDVDFTVCLSANDETSYMLSWTSVENAVGYTISVNDAPIEQTIDSYIDEYDLTAYVTAGEENTVSITALGDGEDYQNSETVSLQCVAEIPTIGLSYKKTKNGYYEVSAGEAKQLESIIIPDVYNYCEVAVLADEAIGNKMTGIFTKVNPYPKYVRLPKNLKKLGNSAFGYCTSLEEIIIPETATTWGERVFEGCQSLKNVVLPSTLNKIAYYAFRACVSLQSIRLPETITYIDGGAFIECCNLSSIVLPECLEYIGEAAFNSTGIKEVSIPKSVKYIGKAAYFNKNIETVEIPDDICLKYMGGHVFHEDSKWYKNLPDGYLCFGDTLYRYKGEMAENTVLTSFPMGITKLAGAAFEGCENLVSVTIPDGWETVSGEGVFKNCTSLQTVILPESLKRIEDEMFSGCVSLTEIIIPENVEYIGIKAFRDCDALKRIVLPNSVTVVGSMAFFQCDKLEEVVLSENIQELSGNLFGYCKSLRSFTIPQSVKKIDLSIISFSGVESLIIPKSIEEINVLAFYYSTALICYEGTEEDWNKINFFGEISEGDLENIPPTYFYSENEPALTEDGTAYDGNFWHYDENGEIVVWVKQSQS